MPVCKGDLELNTIKEDRPYVVLVSLDGFRWDYAAKYGAGHLRDFTTEGASAPEGMVPAYPSLTFPNHYTIATGLYPEHHGIVANSFYEPSCMKHYRYADCNAVRNGRWYGGVPLWSLAEQQGMRSACLFWPGSEAKIAGRRPTFYVRFDDEIPEEARIKQVVTWLRKPARQRPHFITMYYSDVDRAGHEFGPDSAKTGEAVVHVDALMGNLWHELQVVARELKLRIDLIVLSDHGMAATQPDWINLDRKADLADFVSDGTLLYANSIGAATNAYKQLQGDPTFSAYRRGEVPQSLHYNNPRVGDPVIVPTGPYEIRARGSGGAGPKGNHGYAPQEMKDMRAIFYAVGPDIRSGVKVEPFDNIAVYPLIAKILGLHYCEIDGKIGDLDGILALPSKIKRQVSTRHGQATHEATGRR